MNTGAGVVRRGRAVLVADFQRQVCPFLLENSGAGCYARVGMQLLVEIGAVCCVVLLGVGGSLWWSMRGRTAARTAANERASQRRATPHPRLDLAAGVVASSQAVRHVPRRQGIQAPEPPARAAALQSAHSRRPDRAYFNQDNGDLRDPEPGGVPAGGVLRPTGSLSRPER